MIVDCFTFFNELDILELRLCVLDGVVDRFVLCEAPFTFRGNPKPLVYAENKARFARWNDRIVHLVYDAVPDPNPWKNEWGQRAYLTSALADCAPDDLVLIGDVDEIPAPERVASRAGAGRVVAHRHVLAVGYVNRIVMQPWIGTKAIAHGDLGGRTLNDIRGLPLGEFDIIESGWHLSAMGGSQVMAQKVRAYSHVEADIPYLTDAYRLDVQFDSAVGAHWVPLDDAFPAVLREPRWSSWVWAAPKYDPDVAVPLMHAHGCFGAVPDDATAVAALVRDYRAIWHEAGALRYGGSFAGIYATPAEVLAALPAGGWAVIGDFGQWSRADLGALAGGGVNVVAYAANTRSFGVLRGVIEGARFPAGPARGLPELEGAITDAGFRIENRNDVLDSVFPPATFEQAEPFDTVVEPFRFDGTTRDAMHHFSAYAYVFMLRPAGPQRGSSPT